MKLKPTPAYSTPLKHPDGRIFWFSEDAAKNVLEMSNNGGWVEPSKSEVKKALDKLNATNKARNRGDTQKSDEKQDDDPQGDKTTKPDSLP